MFEYLMNIVFGDKKKADNSGLKNALNTLVIRRRFIKMRRAALEIQSFYRYYKNKRIVRASLKQEGHRLQEVAYNLKQRYLMKLRCDLSRALIEVDKRL
tara:strand:+ start:175 stop:471 length:297 start_codon:yes stop_codon:yes gene_type:complete